MRDLERILYFEAFVVVDAGEVAMLREREVLLEDKYRELQKEYPGQFTAKMGAEAIKELLRRVEVDKLSEELREKMKADPSLQKRIKFAKRLKVLEAFRKSGNKPEWMILDVIPVLPPELRPLVPLDGGRFAPYGFIDLFKPFIYNKLEAQRHCTTIKQAKEMVEQQEAVVWDILEDVIREHPVMLNRAPTLHRLGIQAFEPVLVEGKAIRIHPLVCTAFNADFDGDQMAVHIPLSPESQVEASVLMLSSRNILSPAHGLPLAVPSQDMVLGIYYLTKNKPGAKGEGRVFGATDEVVLALEAGEVELLTPIRLRYTGEVIDLTTAYDNQDVPHTVPVKMERQFIQTTVGRVIFNSHLPEKFPYVNGLLKKKGVQQLVYYAYLRFGLTDTVVLLDHLKALGFTYATRSGIS